MGSADSVVGSEGGRIISPSGLHLLASLFEVGVWALGASHIRGMVLTIKQLGIKM